MLQLRRSSVLPPGDWWGSSREGGPPLGSDLVPAYLPQGAPLGLQLLVMRTFRCSRCPNVATVAEGKNGPRENLNRLGWSTIGYRSDVCFRCAADLARPTPKRLSDEDRDYYNRILERRAAERLEMLAEAKEAHASSRPAWQAERDPGVPPTVGQRYSDTSRIVRGMRKT